MHGIKKFTLCYFKDYRLFSIEKGSMKFSREQTKVFEIKYKGHQIKGVFLENIQLKNADEWNLENIYKK